MYRLLIVDDEAVEREGLEWIVTRMMPDTFRIVHAENGRMAIERAEEFRPDIVLMDVKMPGIPGLEALKEIKALNPHVKMVLVTAYDYFEYAKEALTLGVKDYIVKPAKREQIVELLQKLTGELDEEKERRNEELALKDKYSQLVPLVESELAMLFMLDPLQEESLQSLSELLEFSLERGYAMVVSLPSATPEDGERRKMYDVVRSFVKVRFSCVVSPLLDDRAAVFVTLGASPGHSYAVRQQALLWGERLLELLTRQFGAAGAGARVGIGSLHRGPDGFRRSYVEAMLALRSEDADEPLRHFAALAPEDSAAADEAAGRFLLSVSDSSGIGRTIRSVQESREHETLGAMERAKRYIKERFCEELSLEEVAAHVHLNPHYFSKMFKDQAGETFIDYVTRLRITHARELIADESLSLKEVCYRVGYKDPNYFSRVFKKVTGLTPSEYRYKIQTNKPMP